MKIFFNLSIVLLLTSNQLFAQQKLLNNDDIEGIYLTLSDFKQGTLIHPIDRLHKEDKIKLNQFLISPEIVAIENNTETVYYKDSIFAVRLLNGENYRFINRTPCLIADTSYLFIYTSETTKTEYKMSGPHRRSIETPVKNYYFSLEDQKSVYLLTLANLHKYVLSDNALISEVSNKFTTDELLQAIDNRTGHFEINETILSVFKD